MPEAIDALVISLKTRSCPVVEATQHSLAALSRLQQQGCKQIYYKNCSTIDSTAKGNIGPVTDALMDALDTPFTVFSPALPVNGRTVYHNSKVANRSISNTALLSTVRRKGISAQLPMH